MSNVMESLSVSYQDQYWRHLEKSVCSTGEWCLCEDDGD